MIYMKRLFTIAVIAMVTSLAFAQTPLAKKSFSNKKIEKIVNVNALTQKAKQAKEMKAAMAERAAAENETSSSVLRRSSFNKGLFNSVEGNLISSIGLRPMQDKSARAIYRATTLRTTAQEGNVTVETDANGIITNVTGVEPKMYQRAATGTAYLPGYTGMAFTEQSGYTAIIMDGDNVYMKDPISSLTIDTWVKGTKSGNTITIAANQPLDYDTRYSTTLSLRWGTIPASGPIAAADDHAESFTFTVNGDVLTLEGTSKFATGVDTYYMGFFYDDDDTNGGYGDAESVLTYDPTYVAPSTELVTLPAGIEATEWYMNGTSVGESTNTTVKNQKINVAFDGNDVYVQGMCSYFSDAWVKGTINGTTVTFDKLQFVGIYEGYNCWFVGATDSNIEDGNATYDAATKTITFTNAVYFNADAYKLYYLEKYEDIVLSKDAKEYVEPTITDLTAELPYSNTFETAKEQDEAAFYDANEDQKTFTIYTDDTAGNTSARYTYSSSKDADDYLVFPGVELKAGKTYKVSLDAAAYGPKYPERLEVLAGTEAKVSKLTTQVIAPTTVSTEDFATISNNEFTVEADGTYFIAVHAISMKFMFYLYVDNFSIKENDSTVPAAISDLTVTPDANGANKATVTFTVPSKTIGGDALTGNLNVTIERNGESVYSEDKAAGASVTFEDNVAEPGDYTYTAYVSADSKKSEIATAKTYIGIDTPDIVTNLEATDKSGSVVLTWNAPEKGANGYAFNPADCKYNVYPAALEEFWGYTFLTTDYDNPYATGLAATSADIEFDTNSGEQDFTYFTVTAENEAGESEDCYAAVVTGKPFELPILESVAGAQPAYWWATACDETNDELQGGLYLGDTSSDDDGYCFTFDAAAPGWITLESGKINLAGVKNPVMTFDHAGTIEVELAVSVITPNGEKKIGTFTTGADFAPASVSLKEFANEDWVRVIFTGTFEFEGAAFIDNIHIYNLVDNNLVAKSIKATPKFQSGDDITINVEVENQGSLDVAAGNYTIYLYCNDELVDSQDGTDIKSNATASFEFTEPTNIMTPEVMTWKAVIGFEADEDLNNNETTTAKSTMKSNNNPAVTDLTGESDGANVKLSWSEPDMETALPKVVTDDFESYEGFTTNGGEWTFVDVDNAYVGGFKDIEFDIDGVSQTDSKQSFWIHDVTDEATWNSTFAAHSGSKYLAAMYADAPNADDWAISPELSGKAQTISFYAKSYSADYPENIEVYYSTGSTNPEDFVKVMDKAVVPHEWTEYTAELPEGAKYFAIRSCASDAFMLQVDDATFEIIDVPEDLAIVGYNVYRDGDRINDNTVEETTFTDANPGEGDHSYVVTVVYDKGESKASNVVTLSVSGINSINAKGVKVSTANKTITITGAAGHSVSVYGVDGKVVFNGAGSDITRVKVGSGVYMIKIDNKAVKTVVK